MNDLGDPGRSRMCYWLHGASATKLNTPWDPMPYVTFWYRWLPPYVGGPHREAPA